MCNDTTFSQAIRVESHLSLDELARGGAQRMLAATLQAEVDEYIRRHAAERDENSHPLVVRNGRARERTIQCDAGELKVRAPRVYDKRSGQKFSSSILPPYMRKSPRLEEAVPVLYLRGLSTGDFDPALAALLGEEALSGFSATTVTRLLTVWQDEYKAWRKRSLAGKAYVYLWADGVHFNVRLEDDHLTCLTLIGVRSDGSKEVVALEDGYRESTESWKTLRPGDSAGGIGMFPGRVRGEVSQSGGMPDQRRRYALHLHGLSGCPLAASADHQRHRIYLRHRQSTRTTKGAGSRDAGLAMAFKLLTQAEKRWRRVNALHLVALVQAGVKFHDGKTRILPDLPADVVVNVPVDAALEPAIHNI